MTEPNGADKTYSRFLRSQELVLVREGREERVANESSEDGDDSLNDLKKKKRR